MAGACFSGTGQRARAAAHAAGLASIALFLLLRGTNFYGDPHPWGQQRDSMMTALSVLNVSKYRRPCSMRSSR